MVTFVLDASAVLRYIDNEAGTDRMIEIFLAQSERTAKAVISAVNWGEIMAALLKRYGSNAAAAAELGLQAGHIEVIAASAERVLRSAEIKHKYKIPYADSFCVELTSSSRDRILVTADFDFMSAAGDIAIELLPPKPKA